MDLTAFKTTMDAIKNTLDVVRKVMRLKEDVASDSIAADIYARLNAVQSQLTTLQGLHDSVSRRKDALEAELEALKKQMVNESRYRLHALPTGAVVYLLHEAHRGTEPVHALCPHCYNQHITAILQVGEIKDGHKTLRCLRCQAVILSERITQDIRVLRNPNKDGGW